MRVAEVRAVHLGLGQRRAVVRDPAVAHHHRAVDQWRHRAELVRDQHDRRAAVGAGAGCRPAPAGWAGRRPRSARRGRTGRARRRARGRSAPAAAARPTGGDTPSLGRSASPTTSMASSIACRSARVSGRSSRRRVSRPDATTSRTEAGTPVEAPARCGHEADSLPVMERAERRAEQRHRARPAAAARSAPGPASTSRTRWRPSAQRTRPHRTVRSMPRRIGRPAMATLPSRISTRGGRGQHSLAFVRAARFARMRER